jgi:CO/xanthine dehydrogenase FAD-binding subunit
LLNLRLARPDYLVDINGVEDLSLLECERDLWVGAMTRHRVVEQAPKLQRGEWAAFGEAAQLIGHLPIRVRGTLGGSLAHGDPSAEFPLVAVTLDGEVTARSKTSKRLIPAAEFFHGFLTTSLEPDELLVGLRVAAPPPGAVTAFEEFAERAGDFAIAAVCCGVCLDEGGTCSWARIGVGGVASTPVRLGEAEHVLMGSRLTDSAIDEACAVAAGSLEPTTDSKADATFRRELVSLLTGRALRRLRDQHRGSAATGI